MNSSVLPTPTAKRKTQAASKKVTGAFPSRKAAKAAVLALRGAGYTASEIEILRGVPPEALEERGVYETLAKYVRHLVNPGRILIRVTARDIDRASLLFRNLDAEFAVNQFFHYTHTPAAGGGASGSILPVRRWSE